MSSILITGGTGFIAGKLANVLSRQGHSVSLISRTTINSQYPSYIWHPDKSDFPLEALKDAEIIVHLAGAGITDHYWTKSYKEIITASRIDTSNLLFQTLKNNKHKVHSIISASAIGFYGESGNSWIDEMRPAADDFLGNTCKLWEKSALQFEKLGLRVAILRIGIVLAKENGALPSMMQPIKMLLGAPFGSGEQYISWIHIEDLCRQFQFAIETKSVHGIYNAVATSPVENSVFIKTVAKILRRPFWPINIPAFILRIFLGEKAVVILSGQRVSNEKIRLTGFTYKFNDLEIALRDLLKKL